jgi:hypothetical protein
MFSVNNQLRSGILAFLRFWTAAGWPDNTNPIA